MSNQLINFSESTLLKKEIAGSKYLWIIDSYDLKSEEILSQVKKHFNTYIINDHYIQPTTGNIRFRTILVELKQ